MLQEQSTNHNRGIRVNLELYPEDHRNYQAIGIARQAWKRLAAAEENTSLDHTFFVLLLTCLNMRGVDFQQTDIDMVAASVDATKYLKKAFTPVSNKVKLANGREPYDTLVNNLIMLSTLFNSDLQKTMGLQFGIILTEKGIQNISILADILETIF